MDSLRHLLEHDLSSAASAIGAAKPASATATSGLDIDFKDLDAEAGDAAPLPPNLQDAKKCVQTLIKICEEHHAGALQRTEFKAERDRMKSIVNKADKAPADDAAAECILTALEPVLQDLEGVETDAEMEDAVQTMYECLQALVPVPAPEDLEGSGLVAGDDTDARTRVLRRGNMGRAIADLRRVEYAQSY